jgi:hypothetical protein
VSRTRLVYGDADASLVPCGVYEPDRDEEGLASGLSDPLRSAKTVQINQPHTRHLHSFILSKFETKTKFK